VQVRAGCTPGQRRFYLVEYEFVWMTVVRFRFSFSPLNRV
jgi:hypothetical protein